MGERSLEEDDRHLSCQPAPTSSVPALVEIVERRKQLKHCSKFTMKVAMLNVIENMTLRARMGSLSPMWMFDLSPTQDLQTTQGSVNMLIWAALG